MLKQCVQCELKFHTYDSRQKNCSKQCADISRAQWKSTNFNVETPTGVAHIVSPRLTPIMELPPPEELPAPYAKRVYDMWVSLLGDKDVRTRIA